MSCYCYRDDNNRLMTCEPCIANLEAELEERHKYIEEAIATLDGNIDPIDWRKDGGELLRKIAQTIESKQELESELVEAKSQAVADEIRREAEWLSEKQILEAELAFERSINKILRVHWSDEEYAIVKAEATAKAKESE